MSVVVAPDFFILFTCTRVCFEYLVTTGVVGFNVCHRGNRGMMSGSVYPHEVLWFWGVTARATAWRGWCCWLLLAQGQRDSNHFIFIFYVDQFLFLYMRSGPRKLRRFILGKANCTLLYVLQIIFQEKRRNSPIPFHFIIIWLISTRNTNR